MNKNQLSNGCINNKSFCMEQLNNAMPNNEELFVEQKQQGSKNQIDCGDEPLLYDDDDDLILNSVSRVRLVQFQKDSDEPMGITLKVL